MRFHEEVQRQLQQVTMRNNAFMDYINQKMIEDVKLKAKLDGIPKTWSKEDLMSKPYFEANYQEL